MAIELKESFASESGHWYGADGAPRYTVIGKNGKERATTLRDARELGLVPSVTTIMALEAKPALERWKIQQACLACLTLPRNAGESDDDFMARALNDSREQARNAAARGTYLHGLLEDWTRAGRWPFKTTAADLTYVQPVADWLATHFPDYRWNPERSFTAPEGYGGKLDLHGEHSGHVILDYKFKDFRDASKPLAYDEHCTQLAAYRNGIAPRARCFNLFVSSTVPGLIVPREWSDDELRVGWQAFGYLLSLWKTRKGIR